MERFSWIFDWFSSFRGENDYESKKRKLIEISDGASSSASLPDSEAKHGRKEAAQQVNDSLDKVGEQSGNPTMQVLFFHGLPLEDYSNVHLTTWENGDGVLWPQAWLEKEFPGAHIFFVKYGAALRNPNFNRNNIGENLMSDLLQAIIGQVRGCQVVLVGHCIGGLIIKALCLKMDQERQSNSPSMNDRAQKHRAFLDSMRGIFYYSTPHLGILEITKASGFRDHQLFKYFEVLSTDTSVLNSDFSKLCRRYRQWKIEGVGESLPVNAGVFKNVLVVTEASARDGFVSFKTLAEDHFSITKPKEKTSGGFYCLTKLLHNIAKEENTVGENHQYLPDSIVGVEIPLVEVKGMLKDVAKLVLTGMGGSGKTTLAKGIFNELGCKFEYTCFVPDVKFISGREEDLKEAIWKHMHCNGKKVGGEMNWCQLRRKGLILILDDVGNERDIKVLSEIAQGSATESCFLATSRRKDLMEHFYEVPYLVKKSAKQLFTSFVLNDKEILPSMLEGLVEKIVDKCEGLPLTVEVLGQYLRRTRNEEDWKQTLVALCKADAISDLDERFGKKTLHN